MSIVWTRRRSTWHDPKWGWLSLPPGLRAKRVGLGSVQRRERAVFQGILKRNPGHVLIWLMSGVRAVPKDMLLEATNMTDPTDLEKEAMAAALRPLGEYVGSIGMQRSLADYSKHEVLTMVEVVITAYQNYMVNANPNDIPF